MLIDGKITLEETRDRVCAEYREGMAKRNATFERSFRRVALINSFNKQFNVSTNVLANETRASGISLRRN